MVSLRIYLLNKSESLVRFEHVWACALLKRLFVSFLMSFVAVFESILIIYLSFWCDAHDDSRLVMQSVCRFYKYFPSISFFFILLQTIRMLRQNAFRALANVSKWKKIEFFFRLSRLLFSCDWTRPEKESSTRQISIHSVERQTQKKILRFFSLQKMNKMLYLSAVTLLLCNVMVHGRALDDRDNSIQSDDSGGRDWVKISEAPAPKVFQQIGSSVELECEVSGSPPPTVHWVRGNKPIESVSDAFHSSRTAISISIIFFPPSSPSD